MAKKQSKDDKNILDKLESLVDNMLDNSKNLELMEQSQIAEIGIKFLALKNKLSTDNEWAKSLTED